ncbi:MAG: phage resistance protein [Planctomycetota bacterium]
MTLLKDLIQIPEQVHKGDFVLKLAEGVQHPAETLGDYVITEQIRTAFDQALTLIKSALAGNQSKAAFLHGSFGSGKSHFLAVLHLLLAHNPEARSNPDLAPVVKKHGWLDGKKFLLVPFHMIGRGSLEQAVFDQYQSYVRRLHPEATVPAVFLGEPVLQQAEVLRAQLGDEKLLATLGGGGGLRKRGGWTIDRYHAARSAPPNDAERLSLISAIVTNLLPGYASVIGAGDREGFVPIDEGLGTLSRHAKELGYDALLLFLDEVILWLASMVSDQTFVNREGPKLSKLVEFQTQRDLPIVSLLARQRDLRELVGEHVPGAEKLSFLDALKFWEGRFDTIRLEDKNLHVIVERRLLKPTSDNARVQIDGAFAETRKLRQEVQDILRTSSYTDEDFRRVYPFTPALVQVIVAVSSVLQRERTAIRVLMQLLVDQRETLRLGQIVPVGDLYDAIADGDEPFGEGQRVMFDACRKLYRNKIRPRLCHDQGLAWDAMQELPATDPKRQAFARDDRLIKTLLLASLAPEVEALKNLNAQKLVALNHGTFKSAIPGQETSTVLNKLQNWAADISEIQSEGDPKNPTWALRILGVDTAAILEKARHNDNPGNRKIKVREILFGRLGIEWKDEFEVVHEHVWRGTRRRLTVVYGNVREMPPASLRARGDDWKLVIDFPFDEEGHEPKEDLEKVEAFREKEGSSRTVCWLPAFLSRERQADLGSLVALDYALASEARFHDLAAHLPPAERAQARAQLDSQRGMLRARIEQALEAAYGLGKEQPGMLGASLPIEERIQCLDSVRVLPRPVATLGSALGELCDQMLRLQFPKHPDFGVEIKAGVLGRVFGWVQKAARADMHRVVVDKERRAELRAVVQPLDLGDVHEDALVLRHGWSDLFTRCTAQAGGAMTVGLMRGWTDQPEPRGLPPEVQDLLIHTHAELNNLRFFLHGGPVTPAPGARLLDEYELKPQPLPSQAHFDSARDRSHRGFGVPVGEVLGATNVAALIDGVCRECAALPAARDLSVQLRERCKALGLPVQEVPRGRSALAVVTVLEALEKADPALFVERLATVDLPCSWEVFGSSLKQAGPVAQALRDTRWTTMESAFSLATKDADAKRLRDDVLALVSADELAVPLPARLRALEAKAEEIVSRAVAPPPPPRPSPQPGPGVPPTSPQVMVVEQGEREALDSKAFEQLSRDLQQKLTASGGTLSLSWRIERKPKP